MGGLRSLPVGQDADGTDAIGAVIEEDAKIVLIRSAARARLKAAQPPFRTEMLEEGQEPVPPIMVTRVGGQGAGDVRAPVRIVGETRSPAVLPKKASTLALERYDGSPVRDVARLSSILPFVPY